MSKEAAPRNDGEKKDIEKKGVVEGNRNDNESSSDDLLSRAKKFAKGVMNYGETSVDEMDNVVENLRREYSLVVETANNLLSFPITPEKETKFNEYALNVVKISQNQLRPIGHLPASQRAEALAFAYANNKAGEDIARNVRDAYKADSSSALNGAVRDVGISKESQNTAEKTATYVDIYLLARELLAQNEWKGLDNLANRFKISKRDMGAAKLQYRNNPDAYARFIATKAVGGKEPENFAELVRERTTVAKKEEPKIKVETVENAKIVNLGKEGTPKTLWGIAEKYYGSGHAWKEIAMANGLDPNNEKDLMHLEAGMAIRLPKQLGVAAKPLDRRNIA